jgi:FlaA1/EpsC-like NDP-sugar epimerase
MKRHPLMEIGFDLRGKTGILTRVAGLLTIQMGARLCLVDRDEKGLHRLVSEMGESRRADSVPLICDVAEASQVDQRVTTALKPLVFEAQ